MYPTKINFLFKYILSNIFYFIPKSYLLDRFFQVTADISLHSNASIYSYADDVAILNPKFRLNYSHPMECHKVTNVDSFEWINKVPFCKKHCLTERNHELKNVFRINEESHRSALKCYVDTIDQSFPKFQIIFDWLIFFQLLLKNFPWPRTLNT